MYANRIKPRALLALPTPDEIEKEFALDSAVLTLDPAAPVVVFTPLHYEANYAYPLFVWLHGPEADEGHLRRVMPLVSMRNYLAVAPRGTQPTPAQCQDAAGYAWSQDADAIDEAESRVAQAIAAAAGRFRIHPRRVFLAGFDCGGTMALRLAMRQPQLYGGVASLGGPLPSGGTPLARLNHLRRVPVLLAAGSESLVYPPDRVCEDLRLLHAAGMSVTLRHYSCGQEIVLPMLTDLNRWVMAQICGGEPKTAASETPAREE